MKNAWMYKDESLYLENKAREMELPSIEEQADPPPRPLEVEGWTYQNINHVFHNPDTLPLSYEEKLELVLRLIDNESLTPEDVDGIKDQLDYLLDRAPSTVSEPPAPAAGSGGCEWARPQFWRSAPWKPRWMSGT